MLATKTKILLLLLLGGLSSCGSDSRTNVNAGNEAPTTEPKASLPPPDPSPPPPGPNPVDPSFTDTSVVISSLGTALRGSWRRAKAGNANVNILLHDSGSNMHEFANYKDSIFAAGFDLLLVDLRTGAQKFGLPNLTVSSLVSPDTSLATLILDLNAIIDFASDSYSNVVATAGGLTSAALIKEARTNVNLDRIAVFSSPDFLEGENVFELISAVFIPTFVAAPAQESASVDILLGGSTGKPNIQRHSNQAGNSGIALLDNAASLALYLAFIQGS